MQRGKKNGNFLFPEMGAITEWLHKKKKCHSCSVLEQPPHFGGKQAKRESILRVEKVAFCLVEGATQDLVAVWNAQTYTACPIG